MKEQAEMTGGVTGGVDTHADVHVCVVVCSSTHRRLGVASFPVNTNRYWALLGWLRGFGVIDKIGVEGTGTYSAGLTRFLAGSGVEVVEVNRPDRSELRF